MSTKNSSDSVRISAKEKMKAEMWTNRGGEHRFYISKMHDEKSNNDGTKNSSEAPEDCFVRISGEEKMKVNAVMNKKYPNVTKDSIVRISAKEKMRSDAVLHKKNLNVMKDCIVRISAEEKMKSDAVLNKMNPNMMTKKCLKTKRKSSYKEENEKNCQAEQSDEAPKEKKMKIMLIELSDDDEDDFKISNKKSKKQHQPKIELPTTIKNPTKKTGKTEEEKEIRKWWEEKDKKTEGKYKYVL